MLQVTLNTVWTSKFFLCEYMWNYYGLHHRHCHHPTNMQFGHLTCFVLTLLRSIFNSLPWFLLPFGVKLLLSSAIYNKTICLHVPTNFFHIAVFCQKLGLYLVILQSLCLLYNLFKCILLFFSYISSLLPLLFKSLML